MLLLQNHEKSLRAAHTFICFATSRAVAIDLVYPTSTVWADTMHSSSTIWAGQRTHSRDCLGGRLNRTVKNSVIICVERRTFFQYVYNELTLL
jgi:hypothetical protein